MNAEKHIPAMTPKVVHDYLREIGSQWTGQGSAVELGSWLGATAHPLLEGLQQAGFDKSFYCFDMWRANREQVQKAYKQGMRIRERSDILPLFLKSLHELDIRVKTYKGNIRDRVKEYPKEPIEICIFDAPKQEPTFSIAINTLKPYWIPGVTILGLLDYWFYLKHTNHMREKFRAPEIFMEKYGDHFEKIKEWDPKVCSCVFFKYIKKI